MGLPKYTIYCHTHIASGRRYVGLTKKTMLQRWNCHLSNAKAKQGKGCRHFWNAIRKYGKDAFSHKVLEVCHSLEVANLAEECWIELFNSRDPQSGFNIKKGGSHVPHPIRSHWDRPGVRERASSSWKKWFEDPINAAAHSLRSKEVNARPEVRKKQSESTTRQFSDPAARSHMSEIISERHRDPDIAASFLKGLETANKNRREKTRCKNGHEFTLENTRIDDNGWRYCKRCNADRIARKSRDNRTSCKNGHPFAGDSFKMSKSDQRVCMYCLPTHCKNGHEFTHGNTTYESRRPNVRICRTCKRTHSR